MMMFGLHQELANHHHHHQPRGPSLKEEPLAAQLAQRAWMQPGIVDQSK